MSSDNCKASSIDTFEIVLAESIDEIEHIIQLSKYRTNKIEYVVDRLDIVSSEASWNIE
jgi:hypothetical protein